ncbi:hypothetical protein RJ639_036217 [Escallonia herrerae]|uniref:Uncharacterized protein n=1 Tax=Escallonia herrerae TaxID=1293975 RepID=A0AA89BCF9_9ASTE|nr:hypothetical protein RJ639_036217 [Escallonia herrerae]
MLFYLTTLNLARFLQEDAPDLGENPDRQTVAAMDAWKHSDFSCKNYILNGLDNALYNVYSPIINAKALWESLERKYKTEDAGSKKFVFGKFLDFKMVDSKTVISQVQEFQLILHDIHAEGMHKRKEMKLEDLIVRLRIRNNRQSEKRAGNYHQEAKANVVEQGFSAGGSTFSSASVGFSSSVATSSFGTSASASGSGSGASTDLVVSTGSGTTFGLVSTSGATLASSNTNLASTSAARATGSSDATAVSASLGGSSA